MRLDDYFHFAAPDDIRVAGTRIGIEQILFHYVYRARTPEEIAARFPTLNLEQVYATILYFLRDRATIGTYLADWLAWSQEQQAQQDNDPAWLDFERRMREARASRQEHQAVQPSAD